MSAVKVLFSQTLQAQDSDSCLPRSTRTAPQCLGSCLLACKGPINIPTSAIAGLHSQQQNCIHRKHFLFFPPSLSKSSNSHLVLNQSCKSSTNPRGKLLLLYLIQLPNLTNPLTQVCFVPHSPQLGYIDLLIFQACSSQGNTTVL